MFLQLFFAFCDFFDRPDNPGGHLVMVIWSKSILDMIIIENTQECFVQLWRMLERTRQLLTSQCKRFCIRRVLKSWFPAEANDDFIWEVCNLCEQAGWDELQAPSLYPRKHRELLRAIVAVKTGISFNKVDLKALDKAYSIAFPHSTPINVNKKKRS